jgi:hypothetical protein
MSHAAHLRTRQTYRRRAILLAVIVALIVLESIALYVGFTRQHPGANDFFVRWLGGREYLLHGVNPYNRAVAEQSQIAMFGRLTTPQDKDEAYFAYPLYTLYFSGHSACCPTPGRRPSG